MSWRVGGRQHEGKEEAQLGGRHGCQGSVRRLARLLEVVVMTRGGAIKEGCSPVLRCLGGE